MGCFLFVCVCAATTAIGIQFQNIIFLMGRGCFNFQPVFLCNLWPIALLSPMHLLMGITFPHSLCFSWTKQSISLFLKPNVWIQLYKMWVQLYTVIHISSVYKLLVSSFFVWNAAFHTCRLSLLSCIIWRAAIINPWLID